MGGYRADRRWSDRFISRLKQIAGYYLLEAAPEEEDRHRNTDLIVLTMKATRIACRVRRWTLKTEYHNEFTIRCSRPNGCETEFAKILNGWGDYLLYAFANEKSDGLALWHWVDLDALRIWCLDYSGRYGIFPGMKYSNTDGSSEFLVFDVRTTLTGVVLDTRCQRPSTTPPTSGVIDERF